MNKLNLKFNDLVPLMILYIESLGLSDLEKKLSKQDSYGEFVFDLLSHLYLNRNKEIILTPTHVERLQSLYHILSIFGEGTFSKKIIDQYLNKLNQKDYIAKKQ